MFVTSTFDVIYPSYFLTFSSLPFLHRRFSPSPNCHPIDHISPSLPPASQPLFNILLPFPRSAFYPLSKVCTISKIKPLYSDVDTSKDDPLSNFLRKEVDLGSLCF
ncbi:hypothetical protein RND81_08G091500 [Saponaria officinalis]|uniref:Uncharacterized protein n=1 Tax=Saponaria officinalis TaxID=3572 RepID=A0AAW1J699_SAPOF